MDDGGGGSGVGVYDFKFLLQQGISFLTMKNHLMMDYITNLLSIVSSKCSGESIVDSPPVRKYHNINWNKFFSHLCQRLSSYELRHHGFLYTPFQINWLRFGQYWKRFAPLSKR